VVFEKHSTLRFGITGNGSKGEPCGKDENIEDGGRGYNLVEKESEAYQDHIIPLVRGQECMMTPLSWRLLQGDTCCPGELDEAPLVVPVLYILLLGVPCKFYNM